MEGKVKVWTKLAKWQQAQLHKLRGVACPFYKVRRAALALILLNRLKHPSQPTHPENTILPQLELSTTFTEVSQNYTQLSQKHLDLQTQLKSLLIMATQHQDTMDKVRSELADSVPLSEYTSLLNESTVLKTTINSLQAELARLQAEN